jgi:hypothetical protein
MPLTDANRSIRRVQFLVAANNLDRYRDEVSPARNTS